MAFETFGDTVADFVPGELVGIGGKEMVIETSERLVEIGNRKAFMKEDLILNYLN